MAGHLVRCAIALGALVAVLAAAPAAGADPLVQTALANHRRIERTLDRIETQWALHSAHLSKSIIGMRHALSRSPRLFDPSRWRSIRGLVHRAISHLGRRMDRRDRKTLLHLKALRSARDDIARWLDGWGTFRTCPVAGTSVVIDNFGVIVNLPEVPIHVHMGNDIMAATGTPIVAPFEGEASASSSVLGGLEVRVKGADGYVYNAHLSAYGQLGHVKTGDVIGYVGITGDATGPHDHFEWHPGDGPAVDPNPLLSVVC